MEQKNLFIFDKHGIGFSRNGKQIDDEIIERSPRLTHADWTVQATELCLLLNKHLEQQPYKRMMSWRDG